MSLTVNGDISNLTSFLYKEVLDVSENTGEGGSRGELPGAKSVVAGRPSSGGVVFAVDSCER